MLDEILNNPWSILIIDDSKLNRFVIQKTLSEYGMLIDEAVDGLQGVEMLKTKKYDLVLVDIIMPRLDGFGFLEAIKPITADNFIPVILMTGLDDLNSKIMGLTIGADDFLLKPLNTRELVARVLSLLRLKKTHDELFEKNSLIQTELKAARKVQQYVVPLAFPEIPDPAISCRYLPIEQIGGDFFDVFRLDGSRYGFLIADVTGHGIPAALVMSMSTMLFRFHAPLYDQPSDLFRIINTQAKSILLDGQYITAFYLIYDEKEKTLSFCNAGHTRALYYRRKKSKVIALDTEGFFLGIADISTHENRTIHVEKGDRLFLYTDGIAELKNNAGEDFGEKGLARSLKAYPELKGEMFCDTLLSDLDNHASLATRSDDIAFMCIDF